MLYLCTVALVFMASIAHAQDSEPLLLQEQEPLTLTGCGVERWDVKTLSDADTSLIDFASLTPATVTQLCQLPKFTPGDNTPRQPSERVVYQVQALLYAYKLEDDGDMHMLLRDPATDSTLVTEIPNPDCPEVSGTSRSMLFAVVRQWLRDSVGNPTTSFKYLPTPKLVTVTGVAFYDQPHNQTGKAANNMELHPVWSVSSATASRVNEEKGLPGEMNLSTKGKP